MTKISPPKFKFITDFDARRGEEGEDFDSNHEQEGEDFNAHHGEEGEGSLLFLNIYLYSSPSSLQITQETSLMIIEGVIVLINHQVNKDFLTRQDTSFRVMAMLMHAT